MTTRVSLLALTLLNLAVLALSVTQQLRPAFAENDLPVLRGSGLQIVDGQGRVRASISVLPPGGSDEQSETVLLRLITERGRPTVKIGASEPSSGLSFAGPDRYEGQLPDTQDKRYDELA